LIDGFDMVIPPNSCFLFIRYRSSIMPGAIVLVPLVDTLLIVGYVFAFAIETSEVVGAFHPVVRLFSDFATTRRIVVMILDAVPCSASSAFDMIESACLCPVVPLPAFLALQHELPRPHIFHLYQFTTYVVYLVHQVPRVDSILGIPYIHEYHGHII
jgi:hypothetical protein